jgi:hypothetical protein
MKKKRNGTPEKLVEAKFKFFGHMNGWELDVIDSKAQFSAAAGVYKKSKAAPAGFADMVGFSHNLEPVYLELKAPGQRHTVRDDQLQFLVKKIVYGAFAIVTDDPAHMTKHYNEWLTFKKDKIYLLKLLNHRTKVATIIRSLQLKDKELEQKLLTEFKL